MAVTSLRGMAGVRVRRAMAALGRPAGFFGVRLMVSAAATIVLVIAIIGAGRPARPQARGYAFPPGV